MKKNISWQVLIIIGLVGSIVGRFIDGIIGNAIGVIGDICLLIGIVNAIIALIKNRKMKKEQKKNLIEGSVVEIKKVDANKNFDKGTYAGYLKFFVKHSPVVVIIVLVIVIIFLINDNVKTTENNPPNSLEDSSISIKKGSSDIMNKNDSRDSINMVNEYGVEVLQIGGIGSRITQVTAYLLNEHGYLKPSENWVIVSFNNPADIMDVACVNNYTVISCKVNNREAKVDSMFGCRALPLEDKVQNKVEIKCIKK